MAVAIDRSFCVSANSLNSTKHLPIPLRPQLHLPLATSTPLVATPRSYAAISGIVSVGLRDMLVRMKRLLNKKGHDERVENCEGFIGRVGFAQTAISSCFLLLVCTSACSAESTLWAKGVTHCGIECPPANGDVCTLARVPSPNRQRVVEVRRTRDEITFALIDAAQRSQFPVPSGHHQEIDWFTAMDI
jgi:hypothetical protein